MKSNSTLQEKNKQLKIEVLTGARGYESKKFSSCDSILGCMIDKVKKVTTRHCVGCKTLHLTIRIRIGLFRRPHLNNNILQQEHHKKQKQYQSSSPCTCTLAGHGVHVLVYICIACSTKGSARPSRAFFTLVHFFLAYHEQIQLIAIWRLALLSSRRLLRKSSAENESENYINDFPA